MSFYWTCETGWANYNSLYWYCYLNLNNHTWWLLHSLHFPLTIHMKNLHLFKYVMRGDKHSSLFQQPFRAHCFEFRKCNRPNQFRSSASWNLQSYDEHSNEGLKCHIFNMSTLSWGILICGDLRTFCTTYLWLSHAFCGGGKSWHSE